MRYFRATPEIESAMRTTLANALEQPNGKATQPWASGGDFEFQGACYLALGSHHTEGAFWSQFLAEAIEAGVEEITSQQYLSAKPTAQP